MKRYADPRKTIIFVIIAACIMIALDMFILYPKVEEQRRLDRDLPVLPSTESLYTHSEIADYELSKARWRELNVPEPATPAAPPKEKMGPPEVHTVTRPPPAPIVPREGEPAKIVIIIDDMGMDRKRTRQVMELPGPLTLAFLPYAPQLSTTTGAAQEHGHQLMIHVPMQPVDSRLDMGPLALRESMGREDFDLALEHIFNSFSGYVGINNHMGSKLTQNRQAMDWVMEALKKRGLFFVDSKTIASSVAADEAAAYGLPHGARDVFLDNQDTPEFVMKALHDLERVAQKKGYAVAIGHPKTATINALREWLPTLEKKGFVLVPAGDVVR